MRVLMVEPGPAFSVQDVHLGYKEALLELGCEVINLNFADRLNFYFQAGRVTLEGEFVRLVPDDTAAVRMAAKSILATVFECRPDVVLLTSCFFVPMDTLDAIRRNGIKVAINHLESPYEDGRQTKRAEHADVNVVNDPTNLALFPAGTEYMPHAYRPTVHFAGAEEDENYRSEFCFAGTAYKSRIDFFSAVDFDGIDVALAGNWQALEEGHELRKFMAHDIAGCIDNENTARLYRGGLTSANIYRLETEPGYDAAGFSVGPREIELAACGLWFARQRRPESDLLFPFLPAFDTPAELGDLIRWALDNPEQRQAAADKARAAVASRTFVTNAKRLLQLLDA